MDQLPLREAAPIALLATTDAARARGFYGGVLGLGFVADEHFALVFDLAATMLRIAKLDAFTPQPFAVLGWRVGDAERAVRALGARGVRFERYAGLDQDELGIW